MSEIKVTPLGAGQDVGRSCLLVSIGGKNIMLDCGMHMGFNDERRFPDFSYITDGPLTSHLDCVIISHFHLDHCGALPYMTEMVGYSGPIYMTQPTKALCPVLLEDMRKVAVERKGETNFFTSSMIKDCIKKITTVTLHETVYVDSELEIKAYYAGHVLGAAMFYIRVGSESLVYTGDYNMTPDRHLGAACIDKCRPDLLITESTYATTIRDSKRCRERDFLKKIHDCIDKGGKVLIPVFALGRVQELCILLDTYWDRMNLKVPVYFTMGLAETANKYYRMFITWTNQKIRRTFVHRNMFDFNHIKPFDKSYIDNPGAMVVFATPGMLHAGLSLTIFKKWASNEKNMVIMPGYCVQGTVGYKVLNGAKKIEFEDRKVIEVKLTVEYMSFSAHADAKGIMQLIRHCEPKNVMLVHGENNKMEFLKEKIEKEFKINCYKPENGETAIIPLTHNFKAEMSLNLLKQCLSSQLNLTGYESELPHPKKIKTGLNLPDKTGTGLDLSIKTGGLNLSSKTGSTSLDSSGKPDLEPGKIKRKAIESSENLNKKHKILHAVQIMKNNNLRILGLNESINELGLNAHHLRFSEIFEISPKFSTIGITHNLQNYIINQNPSWSVQTLSEVEINVCEKINVAIQDENNSKALCISWALKDENLGIQVLDILRNGYQK